MQDVGIVIIGRNEGNRLVRCIESVRDAGATVVYVDSGSTDGSPARARSLGAEVVELDRSKPFTAARGRNAGVRRLMELAPGTDLVQFVDGDCAFCPGWLTMATQLMRNDPALGALCGRLREHSRDTNRYRRLLDMEWDGPKGEIASCGGISMMRVKPFREVGGFNEAVHAGEEADLCIRMRAGDFRIVRRPEEMATHDSGIDVFQPWWRRAVRSGHAFAEGVSLHGGGPERRHARALRSIALWGVLVPLFAIALAWPTYGASVLLAAMGYGALWFRIRSRQLRVVERPADASLYATFMIVTKFAQVLGAWQYYRKAWFGRARSAAVPTPPAAAHATTSEAAV